MQFNANELATFSTKFTPIFTSIAYRYAPLLSKIINIFLYNWYLIEKKAFEAVHNSSYLFKNLLEFFTYNYVHSRN